MIIAFHLSINYSTIAFILLLSQVPVLYKWFVFESKSTSQPASQLAEAHVAAEEQTNTHTECRTRDNNNSLVGWWNADVLCVSQRYCLEGRTSANIIKHAKALIRFFTYPSLPNQMLDQSIICILKWSSIANMSVVLL